MGENTGMKYMLKRVFGSTPRSRRRTMPSYLEDLDSPCSSTSLDRSRSTYNIGSEDEEFRFDRSMMDLKLRSVEHTTDFNLRQRRKSQSSLTSLIEGLRSKLSLEGVKTKVDLVPGVEDFPVLPRRAQELCDVIWDPYKDPNEVFSSKFNIHLARKDLIKLDNHGWLNDEIINFYFSLISERSEKSHGYPKVYSFPTYFFQSVSRGGHSRVKRWTKNLNIFNYDIILFPLNLGNCHWCLAVYECGSNTLRFLDSMRSDGFSHLKVLRDYLITEFETKHPGGHLRSEDIIIISKEDVPKQMNGFDCGVFTCRMGEYVSRRAPINFSQRHMPEFRRRILFEIVEQKLL
ncbi:unnamed protein product [Bursaphelenchus xylophilus]|uniref:(pine wood nematode) hypothetical protein n=1 Tax=Bursaphelenchus xylophilus TaxID=6326 RepID=A0A1I7RPE5_BURXY|nr:unnamed protein product [Bursaphelenchus xylophilus]CAG9095891.1 unnamed protein product [Bursaphelenchus xylophilus]